MQLRGPERHPELFQGEGILADPDPILPNLLIYDKGAWVLHMLRNYLGDVTFFDLLQAYATDPNLSYGNITTEEFVAFASAAAGMDLSPVLAPWLYSDTVPELSCRVRQFPATDTAFVRVTLAVDQLQENLFTLALPVHITTPYGTQVQKAYLDMPSGFFAWTVPGPVDTVAVDPEGWVLFRHAGAPPASLRSLRPAPNPVSAEGTLIAFTLARSSRVVCSVYDVRGRRLGQWDLGIRPATSSEPEQWFWSGRDGAGRLLPAGVYWLEIAAEGSRNVHKITLLR